jgi:hypothetical protein
MPSGPVLSVFNAGVKAAVFFFSGEEDEQCWGYYAFWSLMFWKFCNQALGYTLIGPLHFSEFYKTVPDVNFLQTLPESALYFDNFSIKPPDFINKINTNLN